MHQDARWDTLADRDLSVSSECREDDSEISHTLFGNAIKGKMSELEIARHSSFPSVPYVFTFVASNILPRME